MTKVKEKSDNGVRQRVAHFSITGEYLTERVRDCVASDMLGAAFRILDSSNVPHDLIVKVMTGEMKITGDTAVGDHTLAIEPDDAKDYNGLMPIDMPRLTARQEKKFRETFAKVLEIKQRIDFFSNLMNAYGGSYRRGRDVGGVDGNDLPWYRKDDMQRLEKAEEEFNQFKENLEILYAAQGKTQHDLPYSQVQLPPPTWMKNYKPYDYVPHAMENVDTMLVKSEELRAYLLSIEPDDIKEEYANKAALVEWHTAEKVISSLRGAIDELPQTDKNRHLRVIAGKLEMAVDDLNSMLWGWSKWTPERKLEMLIKYRHNVKSVMTDDVKAEAYTKVLDNLAANRSKKRDELRPAEVKKLEDEIEKMQDVPNRETVKPWGLDQTQVHSAWIAPNGDFYGREGSIADFVHMDIAGDLMEDGVIPKREEDRRKAITDKEADLDTSVDESRWLELNGWIKISQSRLMVPPKYGRKEVTFTREQRNTVVQYYKNRGYEQAHVGMQSKKMGFDMIESLDADYIANVW